MKLTRVEDVCGGMRGMACWMALVVVMLTGAAASAQGVSTTTVQGTVYLANGQPGAGTLVVSWPSFTTAAGQAVAADQMTIAIAADGFVSVNLAPNQGATPAGEYYTATYYMSDGSTNTEYWVVPAAAQATIGQVRAQLMPAAQAVQAVSKAYVDQLIAELQQSLLTASGGDLTGPLTLSGDPTQPLQAADKHYVDTQVATAVPLSGGQMTGPLMLSADPTQAMQAADKEYVDAAAGNAWPAMVLRADQFAGVDFGAKLQACLNAVSASYGGTCDARNFTGNQTMSSNLTIATANTTVLLPCAAISTASQFVVTAGTRNVALRGCALRGGSTASGSQGGTALAYSGAGALIQVGDPTYAVDTPGFHLDNVVINTTAATSASAQGLVAYRTQEMDIESVYLLGNANQTGMTLDGTGNYTGGTFFDDQLDGFQTALHAIGHQVANAATTDWMNASEFVRLHIDCPTANGSPVAGTYGINLQQGDGNSFTGGDVEGCATALHLGANAQNNTIVGLRNENSTKQVVADAGSSYNNWMTGGTMFTNQLVDNGTRNSFLDTFHRSFNGLNGDWYGSQQDATLTNHYRLGIGSGNERGLLNRYQTDYGYRWTTGLSDATAGEQFYQVLDELNNVYRLSIGQYNNGQSSTNNQTAINSAGTGAVVLNGSNNSGTGGVVIGSGGPSEATVATIGNTGNAQFVGNLQVGGTAQFTGTPTVRNNADAEVDYYLWPGLTSSQKGSFTYKDWNGNSQWYMVKDASNNWALNSALGGLDSFKAYQSTNSGDTYINASNTSGAVRVNYESGSGSAFKVYGGNSSTLYASFTGTTSIAFPGLAASSGHNCLQVDASGYVTNTGSACASGGVPVGSGSVVSSNAGYIAYYPSSGTSIGGMSTVPVTAGGTGSTSAAGALASLGGLALTGGALTGALSGTSATFSGAIATGTSPWVDIRAYGAVADGATDIGPYVQDAVNKCATGVSNSCVILLPCGINANGGYLGCYWDNPSVLTAPTAISIKFKLQGFLRLGSTLVAPYWENWYGDAGGAEAQFQNGEVGLIVGPTIYGTLGTAISTINQAVTVTPTFTAGNLAHLPVGSAITVAGTSTVGATAVRTLPSGWVDGLSVYTLASATRFTIGEIMTVTGCSDTSFNGTNFAIDNVDYGANTVSTYQTDTTASTASGCSITSLNADSREDLTILCSNGVGGTFNGVPYNECAAGQVTVFNKYAHSASDQWGEVAARPAFNTYNAQEWDSINVNNCYGDCFWGEGSTNLQMNKMGFQASPFFTSGAAHFSASYVVGIHNSVFENFNTGQTVPPCPGGGCGQPSYPYALVFDADPPGLYYASGNASGPNVFVDSSVMEGGEFQLLGESPQFRNDLFEEGAGAAVTIDNRVNGGPVGCVSIDNSFLQDGIYGSALFYYAYTNPAQPGGCVSIDNVGTVDTPNMANQYFNGLALVNNTIGPALFNPYDFTAPNGVYTSGNAIKGEIEGSGANFGPSLLSYGSLPITTSPSTWATSCTVSGTAICTVASVVGPDGPGGQMQAAQAANIISGTGIHIGTDNRATYKGDVYIYGSWVRPMAGKSNTQDINGDEDAFYLSTTGTDTFAPSACGSSTCPSNTVWPTAFGTNIGYDGWHPQVAIAEITTTDASAHNINFYLSYGPTGGGNQFAQPFWTFIPGPNNPACTAAGTCNLTADQIEEARQDQYHGCVPANEPAGAVATCETSGSGSGGSGSVAAGAGIRVSTSGGTSTISQNDDRLWPVGWTGAGNIFYGIYTPQAAITITGFEWSSYSGNYAGCTSMGFALYDITTSADICGTLTLPTSYGYTAVSGSCNVPAGHPIIVANSPSGCSGYPSTPLGYVHYKMQ